AAAVMAVLTTAISQAQTPTPTSAVTPATTPTGVPSGLSFVRQKNAQGTNDFTAGTTPVSVAVGDFNGDGKLDLAVANNDSDDISVLWGNGDGTFLDSGANFPSGSPAPSAIAVGDFNGDGKLDIVTCNEIGNSVSVLLGSGGTTFSDAK